ncbi:MAG: hypothetical protein FJ098_03645 [Deltaproteobacteria bacterium]|nr:hypothetical protein [Deltaproteobacteria bacterium]
MARYLWVKIVFLSGVALAGCGGSGGGSDGPATDVPAGSSDSGEEGVLPSADGAEVAGDDPMLQFTNATCEKLEECGPLFLKMYFGDLEACREREYETVLPMGSLPGMDTDWAACAVATEEMTCAEFVRQHIGEALEDAACGWSATLQDGEPCTHPFQCESRICARPAGASCGTCAEPLEAGADCEDSNLLGSPCGIGSKCAEGKCVALGDVGDPCDPASAPCFSDLGCVDGTCGPPRQSGEPCTSLAGECDFYGQGLVCHLVLGTCTALTLAGPGEPCGLTETAATVCSLGNCYPSQIAGTCTAQVGDGEPCDTAAGPDCLIHAQCVGGTCEEFFTPACP